MDEFGYDWGERIARNINVPEIGDRKDFSFNSSFQLTDQFRLQYRYRKNQLTSKVTKEDYFSGYITSLRGTYQFDKILFLSWFMNTITLMMIPIHKHYFSGNQILPLSFILVVL